VETSYGGELVEDSSAGPYITLGGPGFAKSGIGALETFKLFTG
jgi:hypothetical protein